MMKGSTKVDAAWRSISLTETCEASMPAAQGVLTGFQYQEALMSIVDTREGCREVLDKTAPPMAVVEQAKQTMRCHTIVEAVEASRLPAAGFRDFLPKYHALVAITGSREGSQEVLEEIAPLTAMAELVKTIVRGRRGLAVTKSMQEDLREIIVWHAKRCGASLRAVDGIYQPSEDPMKNTTSGKTVVRMDTKERRLIAKMQAGITVPRSASSSIADSTSTPSSDCFESELSRRYFTLCSSLEATRGVVCSPCAARVSPGVACVAATRPLVVPNPWLDARLLWG